jgi:hypothetical protein
MMLASAFVSFVSCLDACLDAVGVRPPVDRVATVIGFRSECGAETQAKKNETVIKKLLTGLIIHNDRTYFIDISQQKRENITQR